MKEIAVFTCMTALMVSLAAQSGETGVVDVFVHGQEGFHTYRIPSIVCTKAGTLLSFAEGRASLADQSKNKIVMKRSTDNGQKWSETKVIAADGDNSLNNPTTVVEQESGRVFLMYQRIPGHLKEHSKGIATGYDGPDVYRNLLIWSDDDGATWTDPLDVTRSTKRPTGATTVASGPGIGIQLTRGPKKGRLIIPFNEGPYSQWNNFCIYSDDRGATWKCGENVPGAFVPDAKLGKRSQINEAQAAELSDGSVRLNSRQFAGAKVRKTSVSNDGGVTWSAVENAPELHDPSCMGSILRYSFADNGGESRLLYSGPDSGTRKNGTVYLSYDEGKTWPVKKVLNAGNFAYSVLVRLPGGQIGCLFETGEKGGYEKISLAIFTLEWLTDGKDVR